MPMTHGEWTDEQNFAMIYEMKAFRQEMALATDANRTQKALKFVEDIRKRYPVLQDSRSIEILKDHIYYLDDILAGVSTRVKKDQFLVGKIPRI